MANKFVLLAGLPRTGSTLLANILAQNESFHLEGNSGLCQLMWDMTQSCDNNCHEQLTASGKLEEVKTNITSSLPNLYYKDVNDKVIFDKCRPWVIPTNMSMAKQYISPDIKAIVLVRPIDEIIKSFAKLYFKGGGDASIYSDLLDDNSEVIMRSFSATYQAAQAKESNCLFVSYEKIVSEPMSVLNKIYEFINEDKFIHNTTRIQQTVKEDDFSYGVKNMHAVRDKISRIKSDIVLPEWVQVKADAMTNALFTELRGLKYGTFC
mgnify:FL=1